MGYGGASKAVIYGLQKIGFKEIKINYKKVNYGRS